MAMAMSQRLRKECCGKHLGNLVVAKVALLLAYVKVVTRTINRHATITEHAYRHNQHAHLLQNSVDLSNVALLRLNGGSKFLCLSSVVTK
ncbi:hypothetical protein KIN20_003638 [Parelaphostrongylus tenuis]|uniref:Uncharacterized protein n=1 Tax=Parelaphostrongylus tenuis TaxID=148309 RepID=A0AAD5MIM9_PARTN|nr:hypothetical protein KIN20_003638 [Parelaphostrongylus tenuis]